MEKHLHPVISQLHKDEEIIIHCRSGARSGTAKITMTQLGFTKVRNVLGCLLYTSDAADEL